MEDKIIIKDSIYYKHWLQKLTSKSGKSSLYKLCTNEPVGIRRERDTNRKLSIMLVGGPKLIEGELIPNTNYRILQIEYIKYHYYIALKEDEN